MTLDTSTLTLSSGKVSAEIADVLTGFSIDWNTGSVPVLTLTATDDAGVITRSPLATPGTTLTWRGEPWTVGARGTARGSDATVVHTLTCRSPLARGLRRTYKASAEKKVSPSEWVTRRVAAAGGTAICQPSSKQGTIAQTSGKDRQSELDVIANLAGDLDWEWVQWGSRLWFGSRHWAWQGNATGQRSWAVTWRKDDTTDALDSDLTVDSDDTTNAATGSLSLPYGYGSKMRPWDLIQLTGHGVDNGTWLVEQVTVTADGVTPVPVNIARPNPPAKKSGSSS